MLGLLAAALLVISGIVWWRRLRYVRDKLKWAGAAPGYPIIGNALDFRDPTKILDKMSTLVTEHNGICYIELLGRPVLLVTNQKLLEHILSSNTLIRKGPEYQTMHDWIQGGVSLTFGPEWKRSRRILTPSFHFAILEQFVDVFDKPLSTLIKLLNKEVNHEDVDIFPYIMNFALDLICETTMGVPMAIQENPNSDYANAVKEMCRILVERAFNPLKMSRMAYRLTSDYRLQNRCMKLLRSISNSVIDKRRKELESRKDQEQQAEGRKKRMAFLDLLLRFRDESGQPLRQDDIRKEVDTFMIAGHKTTSSAMSFALYCLANHPEVQERALREVNEVLGDGQKLTYRHLQDMKYVEAVIKETLRVYPVVPYFTRLIDQDVVFDGNKEIPRGTTVFIFAYGVNRDSNTYKDPHEFDPARWSETNTTRSPYSYIPFSAGPRNCIGQKFAMLEMKSVLAKILINFELLPANPEQEPVVSAEIVLKSKNGVRIQFRERARS